MKKILLLTFIALSVNLFSQTPYMVKDIANGSYSSSPVYLTNIDGTLYFQAWDATNGKEIWKSDGTANGTVLVKDIRPGSGDSNPRGFINLNGITFFIADDGIHGLELWKTDGTDAGTIMVKDIYVGANSGIILYGNTVFLNSTIFFVASDGINGVELWKTDGTDAGTIIFKDLNPGSKSSYPSELTIFNNSLYFTCATDYWSMDFKLWKSDGTDAGTALLKDVMPGAENAYCDSKYKFTGINGYLYFFGKDYTYGEELWKTDGTVAGTEMVKDIYSGANSSNPLSITNINGVGLFSANNGANGSELWKTDGTDIGTQMIKDIYPGSYSSVYNSTINFTNIDSTLYFLATDGLNYRVWKSDGTIVGTEVLNTSLNMTNSYPFFTNVDGTIFFRGPGGIWKTDGTSNGTVIINQGGSSNPNYLLNVNGILFFQANDAVNGVELWALNTATNIDETANKIIDIIIYPNPTTGKLKVESLKSKIEKVEVYNILGEIVYQTTIPDASGQQLTTVDLSSQPNGIYFLNCKTDKGEQRIKVVKQ